MATGSPVVGIQRRSAMSASNKIIHHPSPNFGPRRDVTRPDMVVIHYTAMDTAEAALERLCSPEFEVSAHYLICERGTVYQMVEETMRAWHAGAGSWGAVSDVNSHSIGIELANNGRTPFAAAQMDALEVLLADIMARWDISPEGVIGHSDMAPSRKADPGPRFDWQRLARAGLSVWPTDSDFQIPEAEFPAALTAFGYPEGPDAQRLAAFRLRFRPWATGPLSQGDREAIAGLLGDTVRTGS